MIDDKKRLYSIWNGMKQRCNNPKNTGYKNYGGRGIKITTRREKFENFYEDMKDGHKGGLSIDRIDVNGNYCKENCRWATQGQQMRNTRKNHIWFKDENIITYFTLIRNNIKSFDEIHVATRNFLLDKGIKDVCDLALRINSNKK